jgi:cytochrome c biogenesis protein CcmG/thiol:disulfide interchange protein DsbE
MAWFRTRLGAAAGLALVCVVASACGGGKPAAKDPSSAGSSDGDNKAGPAEVGKAAPELSIQTVNGKGQVTLDSLQGKVAIVDFWATWCGPCKQSFPKLEELAKQNSGKVQVVGISVDDKSEGVADFAKSNGATFPIGWDDGHTIANRWKVDSMPTTYILDSSGKVRFIHAGYHDGEADAIAKELATLTAEGGGSSKSRTEVASSDAKSSGSDSSPTPPKSDPPTASAGGDDSASSDTSEPPAAAPPKKAGGKKGAKPAGAKKPAGKKGAGKKPKAQ